MNNGDTLILDPGIYRENNITVSRDITIKGNASLQGSFANTIIDGMNEGRIFTLAGDCSFIIDNLSLENGRSPNGAPGDEVYAESGSVTIISSALSGYSSGRAVYARNGTETVINSFDLGQLSQNVMVPTTIPSPSLPASSPGYCMPVPGRGLTVNTLQPVFIRGNPVEVSGTAWNSVSSTVNMELLPNFTYDAQGQRVYGAGAGYDILPSPENNPASYSFGFETDDKPPGSYTVKVSLWERNVSSPVPAVSCSTPPEIYPIVLVNPEPDSMIRLSGANYSATAGNIISLNGTTEIPEGGIIEAGLFPPGSCGSTCVPDQNSGNFISYTSVKEGNPSGPETFQLSFDTTAFLPGTYDLVVSDKDHPLFNSVRPLVLLPPSRPYPAINCSLLVSQEYWIRADPSVYVSDPVFVINGTTNLPEGSGLQLTGIPFCQLHTCDIIGEGSGMASENLSRQTTVRSTSDGTANRFQFIIDGTGIQMPSEMVISLAPGSSGCVSGNVTVPSVTVSPPSYYAYQVTAPDIREFEEAEGTVAMLSVIDLFGACILIGLYVFLKDPDKS
ncbi:MAG: hypothetical protein WAU64_01745 [Methanoregula sp.]|uniref:hypothetical protein n=1 Tax=Methanoregula sp. TaxID=2052170 RepID=UPI003BAF4B1A